MNEPVQIPARYGFDDLDGFVDYFAHVLTLDEDFFIPEEFIPPELRWTVDDVLRGLELGYKLVSAKTADAPLLVECRRLTCEARTLFDDDRFEEGQAKLSAAQRLIETLV